MLTAVLNSTKFLFFAWRKLSATVSVAAIRHPMCPRCLRWRGKYTYNRILVTKISAGYGLPAPEDLSGDLLPSPVLHHGKRTPSKTEVSNKPLWLA
jgi:hypothetical protein